MQEIRFRCSEEQALEDARIRVHVPLVACEYCGSYSFVGMSPHPSGCGTISECDCCFAKRRFKELVGESFNY